METNNRIIRLTIGSLEFVQKTMTHPEVYPWISDDGAPDPQEFSAKGLLADTSNYFLLPNDGSLFIFRPFSYKVYMMHTCVLPNYRGSTAFKAGRMACNWMFENAGIIKIVGCVATNNPQADVFARRIGFKKEGCWTNSFIKDGKAYDLNLFGKEK